VDPGLSYREYTGVDISDIALNTAVARTAGVRERTTRFVVADILRYEPDRKYDVILFRDSLYYVSLRSIRNVLCRYSAWLSPGGVFVVRLYGRDRYRPIVDIIENEFQTVETALSEESHAVVLVFRQARAGAHLPSGGSPIAGEHA
jgi:2-polyprenyl-6-hydroxyphenyl methylase/3-demethylubiquinone-9 3-methyltransferase